MGTLDVNRELWRCENYDYKLRMVSNPLETFRPIVPTVHVSTHCYPELFGV